MTDDYLWRRLTLTGNSRGFGGRELWSFCPASTVDRCASGRAGWYSIVDAAKETERIARRVLGGAHPLTLNIEVALRQSRDALRARETQSA